MEQLLSQQLTLGKKIEQLVINYNSVSVERRNLKYLNQRLQKLDSLWQEFVANHIELESYENKSGCNYWDNDYHGAILKIYEKFKTTLFEALETFGHQLQSSSEEQQNIMFNSTTKKGDSSTEFNGNINIEVLIKNQNITMKTVIQYLADIEDKAGEKHSSAYYDIKSKILQESRSELMSNHKKICTLLTEEELRVHSYDEKKVSEVDEWIQDTIIALQEKFHVKSDKTEVHNVTRPSIKLPEIKLPVFNGNYLKWVEFKELYIQLIHEQPISKAQKLCYLSSNLEGEARAIIQHLPSTDNNYDTAWTILTKRYDNKRLLVNSIINRLMSQPAIQHEGTSSIKSLHDTTRECLMGLKNLSIDTASWSPILMYILSKKLDRTTHVLFEQSLKNPRELPTTEDLLNFLELRFQALDVLGKEKRIVNGDSGFNKHRSNAARMALISTASEPQCKLCNGDHKIFTCKEFLNQSVSDRLNSVRKCKLCFNCLKTDHLLNKCPSRGCLKCGKKHNTLLHIEVNSPTKTTNQIRQNEVKSGDNNKNPTSLTAGIKCSQSEQTLLSTIILQVADGNGQFINCRGILDCGSEINIITEHLVKKLGLKEMNSSILIQGIGKTSQRASSRVELLVKSRINEFSVKIEALVLPQITTLQPTSTVEIKEWSIPGNIQLADPLFNESNSIDILIGAEYYYKLLCIGQIQLGRNLPTLQNTIFGWVVSGKVGNLPSKIRICGVCNTEEEELKDQLEKFWKLEDGEVPQEKLTAQEQRCETYFQQTTRRNSEGRFVVRLPFKTNNTDLGDSRTIAMNRFLSVERKLIKHTDLRVQYIEFMKEYLQLGHMREINSAHIQGEHYFMPHHAVTKPDSTTTKLRVVFDASCKTSSGIALNDMLCRGPTVQDELFSILLRFRLPRYVFTADIEKMYRQILVDESDRNYQLIMWRDNPSQPIRYYQLNTVTYGTTSAPYLATKCLQQLAEQNENRYPLGASHLKMSFYMDDAMCGSNSLRETIDIQKELREILKLAGFHLRKWCSNNSKVLQDIPEGDMALQLELDRNPEGHVKTLGMTWHPKSDEFTINSTMISQDRITKRTALSDIAHLFDPLGLMSPVTIVAKMFIQTLWKLKLDWDAALPMDMHSTWQKFRVGLQKLDTVRIARHVCAKRVPKSIQLHVFADASEKAYGAAVYVRSTHVDEVVTVHLICAKSRVAPLKPITLPRLELCAAKLAAELVQKVKENLKLKDQPCYYWTDSEIVLCWINSEPALYQTFVANRIAAIQEKSIPEQWRHVRSSDNPADIVSRGIDPEKLAHCNLWWYGPMFLHGKEEVWPPKFSKKRIELEKRQARVTVLVTHELQNSINRIDHHNSFVRLQRITAYMLRFINNTRINDENKKIKDSLTVKELDDALLVLIRAAQAEEFEKDLKTLRQIHQVDNNSALSSLSPFLDEHQIIRVGGRLEASALAYDAKHPMLLPHTHYLTRLIMTHLHNSNLHPGPQTLLAITRQRFWPIKGKSIARSVVQHCVKCARLKPRLLTQQMGNLPKQRVQQARPFVTAGVDFCGPFWVHYKIRGKRPQKAYVAVFCCFATKAAHLEVVSDLTTDAFIGALKRFIGRRGNCRTLWCDNATNFVGAKNQLTELKEIVYSNTAQQKITKLCVKKGMDFRFIPPRAPHFGGLWEAAVKSAKYFLQRYAANASLTYEELETAIIEVEAVLNSRPLTQMSADPNDFTALTPGHFLIGEPLTSSIDPQAATNQVNLGQRWKVITEIKQHFWDRWSSEYLNELQQRYKWKQPVSNIKPGMMVVVKDDNLPVMKWPLGRIKKGITGNDGLVRVADVQTASGVVRRAIHRLAPLPVQLEEVDINILNNAEPLEEGSINSSHKRKETRKSTETIPHPKRSRLTGTMLTTLLIIGLILPALGRVNITQFSMSPGLYFERMGDVNLIIDEWKILVFYDMDTYWQEYYTIKHGVNQLNLICTKQKKNSSCEATVEQFEQRLKEIRNVNEIFLQPGKVPAIRRKRGALNIVGNMANALFGVLDSEYAERMSKVIDDLNQHDNKLLQLLKDQTSVINATANIMHSSQVTMEKQIREVQEILNNHTEEIQGIFKILSEQNLDQAFNFVAFRLLLILNNYQQIQSALLNILIDSHQGKINPQLIPPERLKAEIIKIKEHLSPIRRLPSSDHNVIRLYSSMSIEAGIIAQRVLFKIKLPLFSYESFELIHIIPIPFYVNKTSKIIKTSSTFLIIDLNRDQYYPLSDQELSSCKISDDLQYTCRQHHPLYRRESNMSKCELMFISHNSVGHKCLLEEAPNTSTWTPLLNPNRWIYYLPHPSIINMICDNDISQATIQESGIVDLDPGCIIKDEGITIQAHNLYFNKFKTGFIASRNITTVAAVFEDFHSPRLPNISRLDVGKQFDELHQRIDELRTQQEQTLQPQPHDVHQFILGYVSLTGVTILIVCIIIYKFVYKGPRKPKPKPRFSTLSQPCSRTRAVSSPDFTINMNLEEL